jgi:acyl-CoA thioesterase FadM
LRQVIYAVGDTAEVAAEVESVVVHFDYKTDQPRRVPGGLRGKLAAFATL